ncbi:MAG TPA: hypothetical protein VNQ55_04345, partial [Parapedobacter sp.]|nr:hypothetical protein [Parapedobacter sp.]
KRFNATSLVSGRAGFQSATGAMLAFEGNPLFSIYSYDWAGLDPQTGDPMGYLNGQVSKDYREIITETTPEALVFHGSARPTVFGSFRNDFRYREFSLSVNIGYKLGYYFQRRSVSTNLQQVLMTAGHSDFARRWQRAGDERITDVPSMVYPNNTNRENFYSRAAVLVEPADHIRLQDAWLAYDVSFARPSDRFGISGMQVYAYLNNLGLLWKANDKGIDPDVRENFPTPLTISLGIKMDF